MPSKNADIAWLPKSLVCLRYYDPFRFRSDLVAALVLALQVFPASIAIAINREYPHFMGLPARPAPPSWHPRSGIQRFGLAN
jgi:MFS superfamily sulfate permease-like transporter